MLHLHKLSSLLRGFMVTVIQGILGSKLLLHLTQLQFAMTVISKSLLILIWNIGHVLTFSFFPQENLSNLRVEADYLPVLIFLWKAMVLEQNNFCTRKVSFHRVGREVILQTILPMDLCSPFFFHPGLCPEMTQFLQCSTYLTLKIKSPPRLSKMVSGLSGGEGLSWVLFSPTSLSLRDSMISLQRNSFLINYWSVVSWLAICI